MQTFLRPGRAGLLWVLSALAGSLATEPAHAVETGSRLYAPCVVCHSPSAWGSQDGTIPSLAAQQRRYLERQIALFQTGARVDSAMEVVAAHPKFSNPPNIVALAAYLSKLDPNPHPIVGSGEGLAVGEEAFAHICAACHGVQGQGDTSRHAPRLAGQHAPYLRRQIDAAGDLHRSLAPPEMSSALRAMRPDEKDALADYISRLGP